MTRQDKAKQDNDKTTIRQYQYNDKTRPTKRSKTRQDQQNEARQDKTRQDKTRL